MLSVAQPVQMYSQAQRAGKSGSADAYFDGIIGVVSKSGSDFTSFAPDGEGGTVKCVGPITDIAASATVVSMGSVSGISYLGGGPVVQFGATANDLAMVVHFERWPLGNASKFYGTLGIAKSTNGGTSWTQLGEAITLAHNYDSGNTTNFQDIEGGPLIVVGSYYYCYIREYTGPVSFSDSYWSVARCLISSFNTAVTNGTVPAFDKWQGGTTWGGSNTGAQLTTIDNALHFMDIYKDSEHGVYVALGDYNVSFPGGDIYPSVIFSYDGMTWFGRTNIAVAAEVGSYGSLVPTSLTGAREGTGPWSAVYVAGTRWTNATIQRRQFTIGSTGRSVSGVRRFR